MTVGIALYDRVDVQEDIAPEGAELPQWRNLMVDVPVNIEYLGGRQNIEGEKQKADANVRVTMHDYAEELRLDPSRRFLVRAGMRPGVALNVVSVNPNRPNGLDRYVWVMCEEAAA